MYIHGIELKTDTSPHSYGQLIFFFTKKPNKHTEKNWQHIQQEMLVKQDSCMQKDANRTTSTALHKTQRKMDPRSKQT